MQVVIVGGGPSGLYLAVLLRLIDPTGDVVVLDQRGPEDVDGWGIEFSEPSLERLHAADPATYDRVAQHFERWDAIDVHVHGRRLRSGGHPFVGIGRQALIDALAERADALGADIRYGQSVPDVDALAALGLGRADVVVAADGAHSTLRTRYADHFRPFVDERATYHACFGTTCRVNASTFTFVQNDRGLFQAHAFPFDERHSQVTLQCDPDSWRAAGFDRMDAAATAAACAELFAPWLDGHPLLLRDAQVARGPWEHFVRITNDRWSRGRLVLLGDAAHTAHFSTGLATKLAMEDALGLALALAEGGADEASLAAYEAERKTEALRLQTLVAGSMEFFEHARRYVRLPSEQFAYALVTRTQGLGHESLRHRDAAFLERVERRLAGTARAEPAAVPSGAARNGASEGVSAAHAAPQVAPPMFTPLRLRGLTLPNRVVVAPVDLYSADDDGTPNEFHLAHYGARALGGAGLVMTEMVAPSPDARLSPGTPGLYRPEHAAAWRRVTDMVHRWSPARIGIQLGHAGPKGSTKRLWEGNDEPLAEGGWETLAPSAHAFRPGMRVPRAMTRADMDRVRDDFVRATRLAADAGFDLLELQCAHGLLLSAFITPLLNRRDDEYGGPLEHRLRFPLEVFAAVRAAWPVERPASVCISATDWVEGGLSAEEGVAVARAFRDAGADVVQVSAGHTSPDARPVYGRMFQAPLSDRVRNEAGVPTIAVGNITDGDQVNALLAGGCADLCALGRPHLTNPHWTLHAAAEPCWEGQWWPVQYERGRAQLERELQRRVEMIEAAAL